MCVFVKFQLSSWSRTASENYSGSGRVGWVQSDYKAISVQLQLQLPAGTELGNIGSVFSVLFELGLMFPGQMTIEQVLHG